MGQWTGGIIPNGLGLAGALARALPSSWRASRRTGRRPVPGVIWSGVGSGFRLAALAQAEALAVHFEDVDVVG